MNIMKIIGFGACSVIALAAAILFLKQRKAIFTSICVLLSTASIVCSCHFWNILLKESGKNTYLLGYERYPFVLYLTVALILANLVCISFALVFLFKHEVSTKTVHRMQIIAVGVAMIYVLVIVLVLMNGNIGFFQWREDHYNLFIFHSERHNNGYKGWDKLRNYVCCQRE